MAYEFKTLQDMTQNQQNQPKQFSQSDVVGKIKEANQAPNQATTTAVSQPAQTQIDTAKSNFQQQVEAYQKQSAQNVQKYAPLDQSLVQSAIQGDQNAYGKVRQALTQANLDPGAFQAQKIGTVNGLEQLRGGDVSGILRNQGEVGAAANLDQQTFNTQPVVKNLDDQIAALTGQQTQAEKDLTAQAKAQQDGAVAAQKQAITDQLTKYQGSLANEANLVGKGVANTSDAQAKFVQDQNTALSQRVDQEQAAAERAVTAAAQAKMQEAAKQFGGPQVGDDGFGHTISFTNDFYKQIQDTVKKNVADSLNKIHEQYGNLKKNLPNLMQQSSSFTNQPVYTAQGAQQFNNIQNLLGKGDMQTATQVPQAPIAQQGIDIDSILNRSLDPDIRASNAGNLVNSSQVYSTRNGRRV